MACEFSVVGGMVIARITGMVENEERLEVLQRIVDSYDSTGADAILVDHQMSQIKCSEDEAKTFGTALNVAFADRQPCFVAVLVNRLCFSKIKTIDASISCATDINGKSLIRSYFDHDFMLQYLQLWRAQIGSKYADVSWV